MGFGRNQLSFMRHSSGALSVYSALPIYLDQVIQSDKSTEVHAETVIVRGTVSSKGNDITIKCRSLHFEPNSIIDASGGVPAVSFEPGIRPETACYPGAKGEDGREGSNGMSGGKVHILALSVSGKPVIVSNGGKGGRAMDGGNGCKGDKGRNGDVVSRYEEDYKGINIHGGEGLPGGDAGMPGYRSKGGDGGSIIVHTISPPPSIHMSVTKGEPSDPASPGNPGIGGDGGDPGSLTYPECDYYVAGTNGPTGSHSKALSNNQPIAEERIISSLLTAAELLEYLGPAENASFMSGHLSPPMTGAWTPFWHEPPERPHCRGKQTTRGRPGGPGPEGNKRLDELGKRNEVPLGAQDGTGTAIQVSFEIATRDFDDLWLELLTLATEDDYRRAGNYPDSEVVDRVDFLLSIAEADQNPSGIKREILARAYSMSRKICLGFDYYGYSIEHVPLLSYEVYSTMINDSILPQSLLIEESFNEYWDASESAEKRRHSLSVAHRETTIRKDKIALVYDDTKLSVKRKLDELSVLEARVETAYNILLTAEKKLDVAISDKHNGCDLVSALVSVGLIVLGTYSVVNSIVAIASASSKLLNDFQKHDKSIKTLWDARKVLTDDLKTLAKEAKTVGDSVKEIRQAVGKLSAEKKKLPQFSMERQAFDRLAKEFVKIPEAKDYKEAGYDYLKCVETRNQAIVDYNAGLVQLIELRTQLDSADRVIEGIQSALNANTDPSEFYLMNLMSRLYLDTLAFSAQMVHAERKALSYHFAIPSDAPVSAQNVAVIAGAHQRNNAYWLNAKSRWASKRLLKEGTLRLDLSKLVTEVSWETFKATGLLGFTIRSDHDLYGLKFDYLPGLRLTGVRLVLKGAKTARGQDHIPSVLTHHGTETIYLADGTARVFSHRMVRFSGFSPVDGNSSEMLDPDFSENGLYAGVSPFAAWMLRLSSDSRLGLDLSELESAHLEVYGWILQE